MRSVVRVHLSPPKFGAFAFFFSGPYLDTVPPKRKYEIIRIYQKVTMPRLGGENEEPTVETPAIVP